MDKLVIDLLEKNQSDIKNKFDYLIIFLHAYFEYHFPQETVIRKILFLKNIFLSFSKKIIKIISFGRNHHNHYTKSYKINSNSIKIDIKKKQNNVILTASVSRILLIE